MSIYAFTVTRASTPNRARLLNETIVSARRTAGCDFYWHVVASGASGPGASVLEGALSSKTINYLSLPNENVGQHVAWNTAFNRAKDIGAKYFLRIDDDCEFPSKRWLKKLVDASAKLNDTMILSPTIRGLRNPPSRSNICYVAEVPLEFLAAAIGGICRLHPMKLLTREDGFIADVRKPLGSGDATGIGAWCHRTTTPMAYTKHIRVRHAKTTTGQERTDPAHFYLHDVFQHIPYIPPYAHTS